MSLASSTSNNSIPTSSEKVNNKNSVKDSEGKTLTEQQSEYFKNSKVRLLKGITKIKNITNYIVSSYGNNPKSRLVRDVSVDIINSFAEKSQDKKSECATMSTERIDYLSEDSGAGMRKDYAQSLVSFTAIHQIY